MKWQIFNLTTKIINGAKSLWFLYTTFSNSQVESRDSYMQKIRKCLKIHNFYLFSQKVYNLLPNMILIVFKLAYRFSIYFSQIHSMSNTFWRKNLIFTHRLSNSRLLKVLKRCYLREIHKGNQNKKMQNSSRWFNLS